MFEMTDETDGGVEVFHGDVHVVNTETGEAVILTTRDGKMVLAPACPTCWEPSVAGYDGRCERCWTEASLNAGPG